MCSFFVDSTWVCDIIENVRGEETVRFFLHIYISTKRRAGKCAFSLDRILGFFAFLNCDEYFHGRWVICQLEDVVCAIRVTAPDFVKVLCFVGVPLLCDFWKQHLAWITGMLYVYVQSSEIVCINPVQLELLPLIL